MTIIEFSEHVNCPSCSNVNYVDIKALYGSGQVPKTKELCSSCGVEFMVMATVDIDVEASE